MPTSRHYCIGCKKIHEEDEWRWGTIFPTSRKRYFCHDCIACEGCKKVHKRNGYSVTLAKKSAIFIGRSLEICAIWAKPTTLTPEQKMKNLSPEDVLSGVQYGAARASYFGKDTNDWSREHHSNVRELKGALNDL